MCPNLHAYRLRALIVEDEALIADELSQRLSRLGFSVIAAVDSAEQGIAIATRERPDLILMDIRLKGELDGVQAADAIRQHLDVSIVYVSALSDDCTVERAKKTDHDGFLLKPFHRTDLQDTIEIAMRRRAARIRGRTQ
ncbi:MAG TPA: response regulator [Terriglobales bacterium]|nr:response regulator [Terriglobales bacterium]